jgi:hypothetical protein
MSGHIQENGLICVAMLAAIDDSKKCVGSRSRNSSYMFSNKTQSSSLARHHRTKPCQKPRQTDAVEKRSDCYDSGLRGSDLEASPMPLDLASPLDIHEVSSNSDAISTYYNLPEPFRLYS